MTDLSKKKVRDRLEIRKEPHWQKLAAGCYLGFRRGGAESADVWRARYRDREGRQLFAAFEEVDTFEAAKAAAEEWFARISGAGKQVQRRGTVREALESYLLYLREHKREEAAKHAESRFKSIVWKDKLASIPFAKLTKDDVREWRERLAKGDITKSVKPLSPATVNRHVGGVIAGFNRAVDEGHAGSPNAWKLDDLLEEDDETAVFLSAKHRAGIIANAEPFVAVFLRGLDLSGARPGELAGATVADFDVKSRTVRLVSSKGRSGRPRPRHSLLGPDGLALFKAQAKDKLPGAFLFPSFRGGRRWERHDWADGINDAIEKYNKTARRDDRIPDGTTAYAFRHSRISELLQLAEVDPLTTAAQCGTSVKIIERNYHRFIPQAMAEKLAKIG